MSKDPRGRPTALELVRSIVRDETIADDHAGVGATVEAELARTWDADLALRAPAHRVPSRPAASRRILVAAAVAGAFAAIGVGLATVFGQLDHGGGEADAPAATVASPSGTPSPSGSPTSAVQPLMGPEVTPGVSTSERIFDAFTAAGELQPPFVIGRTTEGSCVRSFIGRPDAWRCFTSRLIYDPCFQPPRAAEAVVCDLTPWDRIGVRVQLRSALPWPESLSRTGWLEKPPWAVELADGTRCLLILGGAGREMVGGEPVNYFCAPAGGLWGEPDSSTDPWTAYLVEPKGEAPTKVEVRAVWH